MRWGVAQPRARAVWRPPCLCVGMLVCVCVWVWVSVRQPRRAAAGTHAAAGDTPPRYSFRGGSTEARRRRRRRRWQLRGAVAAAAVADAAVGEAGDARRRRDTRALVRLAGMPGGYTRAATRSTCHSVAVAVLPARVGVLRSALVETPGGCTVGGSGDDGGSSRQLL